MHIFPCCISINEINTRELLLHQSDIMLVKMPLILRTKIMPLHNRPKMARIFYEDKEVPMTLT